MMRTGVRFTSERGQYSKRRRSRLSANPKRLDAPRQVRTSRISSGVKRKNRARSSDAQSCRKARKRRGSLLSYLVHPSSLPLTRFHQFALDRLQIDLGIAQGRLQIFVSQEFTHRWQADPAAELDGRVGVAQPVDRDGFLLIGKMLGACGACLLHVPLEVIPDGAVIESLAIPSALTHITAEEGTDPA